MIKWFCENPDCSGYRQTVLENRVSYVMKGGRLVPSKTPKCKSCGEPMSYTEEVIKEIPNISIGSFSGMNNEQKASVLKKRMIENNKKDDAEGKKRHYRDKVIKKFFGQ